MLVEYCEVQCKSKKKKKKNRISEFNNSFKNEKTGRYLF